MELFDKPNPITALDIVLPKNLFYVSIAIELTLELVNVFIACYLTHAALLLFRGVPAPHPTHHQYTHNAPQLAAHTHAAGSICAQYTTTPGTTRRDLNGLGR